MNRSTTPNQVAGAVCKTLLCGVPLFAPAMHSAWAQTAEESAASQLEEIVVSARKREENLQDTPLSVAAFSAATLSKMQINTIAEISRFTPNVVINSTAAISGSSAATTVYIRGIGQYDFAPTAEPGVGLYVDGVYVARSVGGLLDLADVERVEVLRGPQGTLFGRNTIGGAVSITTKRPDGDFSGDVEVTTGRYDRIDVKGAVNVPLGDSLAARLSIATRNRDGYVQREFDGISTGDQNAVSARLDLLATLTDSLTVRTIVDGNRRREETAGNTLVAVYPGSAFVAAHNNVVAGGTCNPSPGSLTNGSCYNAQWVPTGAFTDYATSRSQSDLDLWGVSTTVEYDVGEVQFKSITAYRDLSSQFARDGDHSPQVIFETEDEYEQSQITQEFQLTGTSFDKRLKWLAGAFYFDEEANNPNIIRTSRVDFLSGGKVESSSIAGYGQVTFDITAKLSATGGLRYTKDEKSFLPDQYVLRQGLLPFAVGQRLVPYAEVSSEFSDWSPMADLAYQWTDDVMTYVRFSEGFKSGGYTQRFFPPRNDVPSFDPEYAKVYELGMKSTLFDRRLRLNGALFRTDYEDLQLTGVPPGNVGNITVNGGEARLQGAELEIDAVLTDALRAQFGAGYLDAEYRSISPGLGITEVTLASQLPSAPEWSLNGSVSYDVELDARGTLTPRVDWSYRSKVYNNAANDAAITQDAYQVVNASVSWTDAEGDWDVAVGATNLTDERYFTTGYANRSVGYAEVLYARPREWYLQLARHF